MLISLVGLPGSGKTTVGRLLARRLGLVYFDSDHVIETRLGCTIRSFFEQEGEAAFRDVEQAVIEELTLKDRAVLSTGGGTPLRLINREHLNTRSHVLYLCATPEEVYRRLRHDQHRPLLQGHDPLTRLRELYTARDPLYRECAHCVFDTGRPSMSMLIGRIQSELELTGVL